MNVGHQHVLKLQRKGLLFSIDGPVVLDVSKAFVQVATKSALQALDALKASLVILKKILGSFWKDVQVGGASISINFDRMDKRHWLLLATAPGVYALWYFLRFGQRPTLTYRGDVAKLRSLASHCPSFRRPYWPPLFAPTNFQLMGYMAFQDVICRLTPSPYVRELFRLSDGQQIALDWRFPTREAEETLLPRDSRLRKAPVVLVNHGAFQSSRSSPMQNMTAALVEAGFPVVVMNRRGYEVPLKVPRISMYGHLDDIDDVIVRSITEKYPNRTLAVVGFSCGTSPALRYLINRGNQPLPDFLGSPLAPTLLCGVMLDAAYDIKDDGALARIPFPVNIGIQILCCYHYCYKHKNVLARTPSKAALVESLTASVSAPSVLKRSVSDPLPYEGSASSLVSAQHVTTVQLVRRLSNDYIDEESHFRRYEADFSQLDLPTLLINSEDDPVCVIDNVYHHHDKITSHENTILCQMSHGSHGPKYGFLGGTGMASRLTAEFLVAAWYREIEDEILRNDHHRRNSHGLSRGGSSGDFGHFCREE